MPDEPEPAELPEEPALELPEEPISWYDLVQKSYNTEEADNKWWPMLDDWARRYGVDQMDYVSDFEVRQSQYRQAHAAWEAECEPLRAEHDNEIEKWQAECDRLNAEHDQAVADWKAECEATEKRNEQAMADYEAAHKKWEDDYGDLSKILVTLCRDEDAAGNPDFRDYSDMVSDIRQNFILVAVECAKPEASSPFYAYDSYWDLYFNWHTEGYYLRQAYRSNAEYQLNRAYALLGIHYDLARAIEKDPDEPLTTQLQDALNGIAALPAGTDPATINSTGSFEVLCNINGKTATKGQGGGAENFSYASDDQINEYVKRLHGNSVLDDLRLAGLYNPAMEDWWNDAEGRGWFAPCGLAFRAERGSSRAHARILTWDGKVVSKATATKADDHWSVYTDWGPDGVGTYWWFTFK